MQCLSYHISYTGMDANRSRRAFWGLPQTRAARDEYLRALQVMLEAALDGLQFAAPLDEPDGFVQRLYAIHQLLLMWFITLRRERY